jgi:hypothetical protein
LNFFLSTCWLIKTLTKKEGKPYSGKESVNLKKWQKENNEDLSPEFTHGLWIAGATIFLRRAGCKCKYNCDKK